MRLTRKAENKNSTSTDILHRALCLHNEPRDSQPGTWESRERAQNSHFAFVVQLRSATPSLSASSDFPLPWHEWK